MTAIGKIRGTRAFRGNHRRAVRSKRRAFAAECRAVERFLDAAKDFAADADSRFLGPQIGDFEPALRVKGVILGAKAEAAVGNGSDAAPLPIADFEYLADELHRRGVAVGPHCPGLSILHFRAPLFQLLE